MLPRPAAVSVTDIIEVGKVMRAAAEQRSAMNASADDRLASRDAATDKSIAVGGKTNREPSCGHLIVRCVCYSPASYTFN